MDLRLAQKNWRMLIKPKGLEIERETLTDFYGRFTAKPFERGFGVTIGNGLRRILLSSLQGVAVTTVRIDGALHEFGALPDVVEDVTEILLNMKEIRFKMYSEGPKTLMIDKVGPGAVVAGDIETDDSVEVLNPTSTYATLGQPEGLKPRFCSKCWCRISSSGNSARHGSHHVAQKCTSTCRWA